MPRFVMRLLLVLFATLTLVINTYGADMPAIVPKPQQMKLNDGSFQINSETRVVIDSDELKPIAQYFADAIGPATGLSPQIVSGGATTKDIELALKDDDALGDEGYTLSSGPSGVKITAPHLAGVFYGVQTLRQMLPPQVSSRTKVAGVKWAVPAGEIRDWPRFGYRGFMLDSGRHIQSVEFIKRTLDLMSQEKLNRFHWHLTEDQGWRIEIKKYPKLTEIGAWRKDTEGDGKRYGGFFTQDQIRDIVKYAADRYITIIPEVDMPGHEKSALASYPELGCTGGPYEVATKWGVHKDVLCAGNPKTYEFVQGVLDEVMELFPSKTIHIGGDECPRDRWKACPKCQAMIKEKGLKDEDALQNYFTHWVAEYLASKGRRLQGWNEIMKGGDLPQNAIVHEWNNPDVAKQAAESGRDVVYSYSPFTYFDYPYTNVSMQKIYSIDPIPAGLAPDLQKHILGIQACLWTEHRPDDLDCDRCTWPRLAAIAEVNWTEKKNLDWGDFESRMVKDQYRRQALSGLGASTTQPTEQLEKDLAERGAIVTTDARRNMKF